MEQLSKFNLILTPKEINAFDLPPQFSDKQLETLFRLPDPAEKFIRSLRSPKSKLSFIMQFAYCHTTFQWYSPARYPEKHLLKVIRLRTDLSALRTYRKKTELQTLKDELGGSQLSRHRKEIRGLLGLSEIGPSQHEALERFVAEQAKKQMGPEALLKLIVGEIQRRKWIVPSLKILSDLISRHYGAEERAQCETIRAKLSEEAKQALLALLDEDSEYTSLNLLKKINQETSPRALQSNAKIIEQLWSIYQLAHPAIKALNLNEQAIAYYARWVLSSDISDITKLANPYKKCLLLLGFVIQQLFERQDAAAEGFMAQMKKYLNRAKRESEQARIKHADRQTAVLSAVAKSQADLIGQIKIWIDVGHDASLPAEVRLTKILTGLIDIVSDKDNERSARSEVVSDVIEVQKSNWLVFDSMLRNADAIIAALSSTLKALRFEDDVEPSPLLAAVRAFQDGTPLPTTFLKRPQRKALDLAGPKQRKLHKLFLFDAVVRGLKSGALNLRYAFVWRSLDSLLKGNSDWRTHLEGWLSTYNLSDFYDFHELRKQITEAEDRLLTEINENHDCGRNPYVTVNEKGKIKLKPDIRSESNKAPSTISEMLYEVEKISVKDILNSIQSEYGFMDNFVHARNRFVTRDINENLITASIIAMGCNIGPRAMIKCSDGLTESELLTTVEHRLTPENLRRANHALTEAINKLALSDVFQFDPSSLHTSSDGQKISVDGESLMAVHSFKYFGSGSGVTRYPFVDERHRMLDTFVFSASIREATYVLDGLVGNLGQYLSGRHSTDTHGYTDAVFALSDIIGIHFSPRIKGIEKLALYGARSTSHYKKSGYTIRPTSSINWSKIEAHWEEILRLVVTILSGKASASQLLRRLNSYSQNPLYGALKEFGRIAKTRFVLQYIDQRDLRRKIQKQLNIGEQANSFFKAVFWARGSRLYVNLPGDEERYLLSAQLIQNAVVLWNYLYITDRLAKLPAGDARQEVVEQIQQGQMLAWQHVNFAGEFDFRRQTAPLITFDVRSLERLRLPAAHVA